MIGVKSFELRRSTHKRYRTRERDKPVNIKEYYIIGRNHVIFI